MNDTGSCYDDLADAAWAFQFDDTAAAAAANHLRAPTVPGNQPLASSLMMGPGGGDAGTNCSTMSLSADGALAGGGAADWSFQTMLELRKATGCNFPCSNATTTTVSSNVENSVGPDFLSSGTPIQASEPTAVAALLPTRSSSALMSTTMGSGDPESMSLEHASSYLYHDPNHSSTLFHHLGLGGGAVGGDAVGGGYGDASSSSTAPAGNIFSPFPLTPNRGKSLEDSIRELSAKNESLLLVIEILKQQQTQDDCLLFNAATSSFVAQQQQQHEQHQKQQHQQQHSARAANQQTDHDILAALRVLEQTTTDSSSVVDPTLDAGILMSAHHTASSSTPHLHHYHPSSLNIRKDVSDSSPPPPPSSLSEAALLMYPGLPSSSSASPPTMLSVTSHSFPTTTTTTRSSLNLDLARCKTHNEAVHVLKILGSTLRCRTDPYIDVDVLPDDLITPYGSFKDPICGTDIFFPDRLHIMLEDAEKQGLTDVVSWLSHKRSFRVHNKKRFLAEIVPRHFNGKGIWSSFLRQLNLYGFVRTRNGIDSASYFHELFLKDRPELCQFMHRVGLPRGRDRRTCKSEQGEDPDFYRMPPLKPRSNSQYSCGIVSSSDQ